jgi:glycosyltransferase involved in cell wall biosynthesis
LAEPQAVIDHLRGREDFHFPGTGRLLDGAYAKPQIIHCHNLHGGYFDLRALPWMSQQAPTLLTLHDAWLLSGHCAQSFECERWKIGCGECPDLTIYPAVRRDATAYNWLRKKEIFSRCRLYVATPSQWLMRKVQESILAAAVVEARVIPNGVDLSIFKPADQRRIRAQLSIHEEDKVLLFAANGIRANLWKDYLTMRAAVESVATRLNGHRVLFIALGENGNSETLSGGEIRFVQYQRDPLAVARYYQAADVYLHAAKADTFPNAVLEALACGTPVVATAVGGIPEQLRGLNVRMDSANEFTLEKATGFLVSPGDAEAMATCTEMLLSDAALRQRIGANAAMDARQRFDLERQADKYVTWYEQINKSWAAERSVGSPTGAD